MFPSMLNLCLLFVFLVLHPRPLPPPVLISCRVHPKDFAVLCTTLRSWECSIFILKDVGWDVTGAHLE